MGKLGWGQGTGAESTAAAKPPLQCYIHNLKGKNCLHPQSVCPLQCLEDQEAAWGPTLVGSDHHRHMEGVM